MRTLKVVFRSKGASIGLIGVSLFLLLALLAPTIAPVDPTSQNLRKLFQPPSADHLMGTDQFGRDVFSRVIYGSRISLLVAFSALALALLAGTPLGILAGYRKGLFGTAIMRSVDILLTFPDIFLAILVAAVVRPGLGTTILAIGVYNLPQVVRVARASALSVSGYAYVEAAQALGADELRVVLRHILPNSLAPIVVLVTLRIAASILTAAGLSFLGLGIQPPTPEWGAMISESRVYLVSAPWTSAFPGTAILLTVLSFNLLGDGLNDALNPRRRGRVG